MLEVSLDWLSVAAMLISIALPGTWIELDSLNSPTPQPIPRGISNMGSVWVTRK